MRRLLLGLLSVGLVGAAAPSAEATNPAVPAHVRITRVTATSFTVSMRRASHATAYRVFVSTSPGALYLGSISLARKHVASSRPSVTVRGLRYTTAALYYRAETLSRGGHSWDPQVRAVYLQPARPRAFAAHHGYLTWDAENAGGFVVTQATNPAMTRNREDRVISAGNTSYAPYGLERGTRYWFQIRARNGVTSSRFTPQIGMTPSRATTGAKVMSYNVLESSFDGTHDGGPTGPVIAPWTRRRLGAAALIASQRPDVVAVQEGAAWVTPVHGRGGVRQIDDLLTLLPGYALAETEIPPSQPHYQRAGDYILFRTSTMTSVGAGGHWAVGDGRWAAYQLVRNRSSGASFLVVAPHLLVGTGAGYDAIRRRETTTTIAFATAYAAANGDVPVVYAGDFNSSVSRVSHVFDGTSIAMRSRDLVDSLGVAQARFDAHYNSSNRYLRTPPAHDNHIDAIYVSRNVAVRSWGLVIRLRNGRFVGTIPSDHNPIWALVGIPH